jgi:hypothetical protein
MHTDRMEGRGGMSYDDYGGPVDPGYTPPPPTQPPPTQPQPVAPPLGPPSYSPSGYLQGVPQPSYPPPYPPAAPDLRYALPPLQFAPPRSRRRQVIGYYVAAAAVVVVIAIQVVVARHHKHSAGNGATGHTLTLPNTSGGYTRMTGKVADRMTKAAVDRMRSASPANGDAYAKARVGVYAHPPGTDAALIFVGLAGTDDPVLALELSTSPASDELDAAFRGAGVTETVDVDAGPLGGVMRCSKRVTDGQSMCAWADRSSVGVLLVGDGAGRTNPEPVVQQFRGDTER